MVEFKLPAIDISLPPMTFDLVRLAELIAYQQAVIDKLDLNLTGTPAENLQTLRTALAEAKKLLDQASALTSLEDGYTRRCSAVFRMPWQTMTASVHG